MSGLIDFASKARESGRIGFGDLRRLQRDILPNGAATPEEVEALLALDGALTRADKGWTEYLSQLVASAADGLGEGAADWVLRATAAARPSVAAVLTRRLRRRDPLTPVARARRVRAQAADVKPDLTTPAAPAWEWHLAGYQVEVRPALPVTADQELLPAE